MIDGTVSTYFLLLAWCLIGGRCDPMQLKQKRAVFSGTARNCAWFLPNVLQNVERLAKLYENTAFVVAENDSGDETKSILRSWLNGKANGKLIELDGLAAQEPKRAQRIAVARNGCLDYIADAYPDYDHVVMIDLDDGNAFPISSESFFSAANFLEQNSATAGVFANQAMAYYDIWALRHVLWCPDDCWKRVAMKPRWMRLQLAQIWYLHKLQFSIPEYAQPIRVLSAFGGLGIYKARSIRNCRYEGIDNEGNEICEHVSFNRKICERGGELYIYPSLVNQGSNGVLFDPRRFGRRDILVMQLIRVWQTLFPPWRRIAASG